MASSLRRAPPFQHTDGETRLRLDATLHISLHRLCSCVEIKVEMLLKLTNISKSFAGVRALKGVSFDLKAGEVHALVGENGAGKSTLIKVITGAHLPDEGTLEICGQLVEGNDPLRAKALGIAAIYQQPALFPDLTVAENIAIGLERPGSWRLIGWKQRRDRARRLLERIGARIDPETEVRRLTMPEQQLVEIAPRPRGRGQDHDHGRTLGLADRPGGREPLPRGPRPQEAWRRGHLLSRTGSKSCPRGSRPGDGTSGTARSSAPGAMGEVDSKPS